MIQARNTGFAPAREDGSAYLNQCRSSEVLYTRPQRAGLLGKWPLILEEPDPVARPSSRQSDLQQGLTSFREDLDNTHL